MSAEVDVADGMLVVSIRGADKIFALKSRLEIPMTHVTGAERDQEEAVRWWHGLKAPGTAIPGVLTAGTFYSHGQRVFWDVHKPENAVAITLRDERFSRLVIEVEDPDATISQIEAAVGSS